MYVRDTAYLGSSASGGEQDEEPPVREGSYGLARERCKPSEPQFNQAIDKVLQRPLCCTLVMHSGLSSPLPTESPILPAHRQWACVLL